MLGAHFWCRVVRIRSLVYQLPSLSDNLGYIRPSFSFLQQTEARFRAAFRKQHIRHGQAASAEGRRSKERATTRFSFTSPFSREERLYTLTRARVCSQIRRMQDILAQMQEKLKATGQVGGGVGLRGRVGSLGNDLDSTDVEKKRNSIIDV